MQAASHSREVAGHAAGFREGGAVETFFVWEDGITCVGVLHDATRAIDFARKLSTVDHQCVEVTNDAGDVFFCANSD